MPLKSDLSGVTSDFAIGGKLTTANGIKARVVQYADAATITPNANTTDIAIVLSLSQTTTIANPIVTSPYDGQSLKLRLTSSASRAIAFGTAYQAVSAYRLPNITTGSGTDDCIDFLYNATSSKWVMFFTTFGGGSTPAGSDGQIQFNNNGAFGIDPNFVYVYDPSNVSSVLLTNALQLNPFNGTYAPLSGGTFLTGSQSGGVMSFSNTWNTTGTPTLLYFQTTDTASNASSNFIRYRLNSADRFIVNKLGAITALSYKCGFTGNIPFIAQSTGTGGFQRQPTDSTTTGGNTRGSFAVDLQTQRTSADQVGSGAYSFTLGSNNKSSGLYASAIGSSNTSSGQQSHTKGINNIADAKYAFVDGASGISKRIIGVFVKGSANFTTQGKSQSGTIILGVETNGVAPSPMFSGDISFDTADISVNQLRLQPKSLISFRGYVQALSDTGVAKYLKFEGAVRQGIDASTTSFCGMPIITPVGGDIGANSWTVTLVPDTTYGCLTVNAVGDSVSAIIRWNCVIDFSEVAF